MIVSEERLFREKVRSHIDAVACNMCGLCCGQCKERSGNLCAVHPTIIGDGEARAIRGAACGFTPIQLVVYLGIACPPAVEYLEDTFHLEISTFRDKEGISRVNSMMKV